MNCGTSEADWIPLSPPLKEARRLPVAVALQRQLRQPRHQSQAPQNVAHARCPRQPAPKEQLPSGGVGPSRKARHRRRKNLLLLRRESPPLKKPPVVSL